MSMKSVSIALAGAAALAAAITACDDRSPTAPSPVPPPSSPPTVHSLGGMVTEPLNVPVEGAAVVVMEGPAKGTSTITDSGGSYSLNGLEGTFMVQVTKKGYTTVTKQITVPQTISANFEIAPLTPHTDISGDWTVTFEPNRTCPDLTKEDFSRYRASIVQLGAQLAVTLSGATFVTPPHLVGTIHGTNMSLVLPAGCDFYCYYGPPEGPAVFETIAADRFLAITGLVTATAGRTSINGILNGEFTLSTTTTPPFLILASCSNEQHRVMFTR